MHEQGSGGNWKEIQAASRLGEIRNALRDGGFDDLARTPSHNAQVRELRPLRYEPNALATAWRQVLDRHGPEATGVQVRAIVRALREEMKSPEERLPEALRDLNLALRHVGYYADEIAALLDEDDLPLGDAPTAFIDEWRSQAVRAPPITTCTR